MTVAMRVHYKVQMALGLVGALAAAGAMAGAVGACSSNSSNPSGGNASGGSNCTMDPQLQMKFNPVYSAFGPAPQTYAVPVAVNTEGATLTVSDTTAVGFEKNLELSQGGFTAWTLTMLKAPSGPVTLTASVGGYCTSAQLMVTSVTSDDWQIGNARYNNGASLRFPMFGGRGGGEGGPPPMMPMGPDGGSIFETADGGPACTSCHGETATSNIFTDVAHTPEQTGGFSDDDLINIVVNGVVPDGGYFDQNIITLSMWHSLHRWADIQPDQYNGMIAYLRSLTPVAQMGNINLGGFVGGGPRDAGGGG